jgi:hypothetical protein
VFNLCGLISLTPWLVSHHGCFPIRSALFKLRAKLTEKMSVCHRLFFSSGIVLNIKVIYARSQTGSA